MKKIMTLCLLIVMVVGGVKAQKGMQSIGLDIGICTDTKIKYYKLVGGGIKYRYHITDNICIEPDLQYYFSTSDFQRYAYDNKYCWYNYTQLIGSANFLYFIGLPQIMRPYVGVGLAFGNRHVTSNTTDDWNRGDFLEGGFQFLLGLDKRLSYHFSLQFEAKLFYGGLVEGSKDSEYTPIMANIGLTYNF